LAETNLAVVVTAVAAVVLLLLVLIVPTAVVVLLRLPLAPAGAATDQAAKLCVGLLKKSFADARVSFATRQDAFMAETWK
jgi:hypothetical protein